jgi:hypothetical protein
MELTEYSVAEWKRPESSRPTASTGEHVFSRPLWWNRNTARDRSPLKLMVQMTVCVGVRSNFCKDLSLVCHVMKKYELLKREGQLQTLKFTHSIYSIKRTFVRHFRLHFYYSVAWLCGFSKMNVCFRPCLLFLKGKSIWTSAEFNDLQSFEKMWEAPWK